nr:MAG TPA: hypothetical protein [Caudoviricetes sp.]
MIDTAKMSTNSELCKEKFPLPYILNRKLL